MLPTLLKYTHNAFLRCSLGPLFVGVTSIVSMQLNVILYHSIPRNANAISYTFIITDIFIILHYQLSLPSSSLLEQVSCVGGWVFGGSLGRQHAHLYKGSQGCWVHLCPFLSLYTFLYSFTFVIKK